MIINVSHLIPIHHQGHECDNIAYHPCRDIAKFDLLKSYLLHINHWHHIAGKEKATFTLTDGNGKINHAAPQIGDDIKVKLPGFQNWLSRTIDWVTIIALKEEQTPELHYLKLQLRPTKQPLSNKNVINHFLKDTATNTIIVAFDHQHIQVSIHGRNEIINNDGKPFRPSTLRNIFVARTGFAGFNSLQWQGLADGLIHKIK